MNFWLIKSDPETYSWNDLARDRETSWDGIRNYAARLHLRAMKKGDELLFYHSGGESAVVGLAKVTKEFYPDPTDESAQWSSVMVKKVKSLKREVTLKEIKADLLLKNMALVKISRLSVSPVKKEEYDRIIELSQK
jgi:predicted RNA-binding protein with PUA-like domain